VLTPPYSFFAALERRPPDQVADAWWITIEMLAAREHEIAGALGRALEQDEPRFLLDLYYFLLDVGRLIGDIQHIWIRLGAREADAPASVPENWDMPATDPSMHVVESDRRAHARVYAEVAGKAREAFQKHGLPQNYKAVHSPMLTQSHETVDASVVDALGEIASTLALVSWYRDFLTENPLPNGDTIRWIVRELQMSLRTRAMRHVLLLSYAFYDVVMGNDLDGGES
jgi:hypothetical protein